MIVLLALFGAAVYEAAIAVEWIPMGNEPGEEARGQAAVTIAAFVALLAGIVVALAAVPRGGSSRTPVFLIPVAAAAYLVAHYYAFDSYYLPTLRRFSDGGNVAAAWVYSVGACAILVAVVTRMRPRIGLALVPVALLACAVTVAAEGIGH